MTQTTRTSSPRLFVIVLPNFYLFPFLLGKLVLNCVYGTGMKFPREG